MSPSIDIGKLVKKKLDLYKDKIGAKTYSDSINYLLIEVKLLSQNQQNCWLIENQEIFKNIESSLETLKNKK